MKVTVFVFSGVGSAARLAGRLWWLVGVLCVVQAKVTIPTTTTIVVAGKTTTSTSSSPISHNTINVATAITSSSAVLSCTRIREAVAATATAVEDTVARPRLVDQYGEEEDAAPLLREHCWGTIHKLRSGGGRGRRPGGGSDHQDDLIKENDENDDDGGVDGGTHDTFAECHDVIDLDEDDDDDEEGRNERQAPRALPASTTLPHHHRRKLSSKKKKKKKPLLSSSSWMIQEEDFMEEDDDDEVLDLDEESVSVSTTNNVGDKEEEETNKVGEEEEEEKRGGGTSSPTMQSQQRRGNKNQLDKKNPRKKKKQQQQQQEQRQMKNPRRKKKNKLRFLFGGGDKNKKRQMQSNNDIPADDKADDDDVLKDQETSHSGEDKNDGVGIVSPKKHNDRGGGGLLHHQQPLYDNEEEEEEDDEEDSAFRYHLRNVRQSHRDRMARHSSLYDNRHTTTATTTDGGGGYNHQYGGLAKRNDDGSYAQVAGGYQRGGGSGVGGSGSGGGGGADGAHHHGLVRIPCTIDLMVDHYDDDDDLDYDSQERGSHHEMTTTSSPSDHPQGHSSRNSGDEEKGPSSSSPLLGGRQEQRGGQGRRGRQVLATYIDTGAQATVMSRDAAERAKLVQYIDQRYAGHAMGVGSARILGRIPENTVRLWLGGGTNRDRSGRGAGWGAGHRRNNNNNEVDGGSTQQHHRHPQDGVIVLSPAIFVLEDTSSTEPQEFDLLLGLDILKECQATICFRRHTLTLRPATTTGSVNDIDHHPLLGTSGDDDVDVHADEIEIPLSLERVKPEGGGGGRSGSRSRSSDRRGGRADDVCDHHGLGGGHSELPLGGGGRGGESTYDGRDWTCSFTSSGRTDDSASVSTVGYSSSPSPHLTENDDLYDSSYYKSPQHGEESSRWGGGGGALSSSLYDDPHSDDDLFVPRSSTQISQDEREGHSGSSSWGGTTGRGLYDDVDNTDAYSPSSGIHPAFTKQHAHESMLYDDPEDTPPSATRLHAAFMKRRGGDYSVGGESSAYDEGDALSDVYGSDARAHWGGGADTYDDYDISPSVSTLGSNSPIQEDEEEILGGSSYFAHRGDNKAQDGDNSAKRPCWRGGSLYDDYHEDASTTTHGGIVPAGATTASPSSHVVPIRGRAEHGNSFHNEDDDDITDNEGPLDGNEGTDEGSLDLSGV